MEGRPIVWRWRGPQRGPFVLDSWPFSSSLELYARCEGFQSSEDGNCCAGRIWIPCQVKPWDDEAGSGFPRNPQVIANQQKIMGFHCTSNGPGWWWESQTTSWKIQWLRQLLAFTLWQLQHEMENDFALLAVELINAFRARPWVHEQFPAMLSLSPKHPPPRGGRFSLGLSNQMQTGSLRLVQTCQSESGPKDLKWRQDSDLCDFIHSLGTRRSMVQIHLRWPLFPVWNQCVMPRRRPRLPLNFCGQYGHSCDLAWKFEARI